MNKLALFFVIAIVLFIQLASAKYFGALNTAFIRQKFAEYDGKLTYQEIFQKHFIHTQSSQENWFTQNVDHFDPQNTQTFQQRYFVNDTFYQPGGPVFIVCGGEGPMVDAFVNGHLVVSQYAQYFNGLVVAIEHRFYGKSNPTSDLSTKNLRLLSSQQALADFATFRQFIAQKYNAQNSKFIAIGGSYSGNLSGWFRLKYPHLIDGSLASSAPVLAKTDFKEYNEVVQSALTYFTGPTCAQRVLNATQTITKMLQTQQGTQQIESLFKACSPIKSSNDISNFFSNLEDVFAETVQYNNDNIPLPTTITEICGMLNDGDDPLVSYANLNNYYNSITGSNCTQISYKQSIEELQNTQTFPANQNAAGRTWMYQTCIEFGYYQTGQSKNQPFSNSISLDWYLQQCTDIFGMPEPSDYFPNTNFTNTYYGSTEIQGSNIFFATGTIDPWHPLGVLPNRLQDPLNQAYYITGTAHCADMYPPAPTDVPGLTECRTLQFNMLKSIIEG